MKYSSLQKFRTEFAQHLKQQPDHVSLFMKGRVGLYGLLQALGVGPNDEVILPAFTCVVVSNAILYLGARPVYADVDPVSFNIDPVSVQKNLTERTKVVIGQNTFGLSCELDSIRELCNVHGAYLIEDCTHGFGGTYKGQPNGTIADAAFFSSQWNKPFSTGIGGMVVCKDVVLAGKMRAFEDSLSEVPFIKRISLQVQLWTKKWLLKPWVYWSALYLYRSLSQAGWITGSSEGTELKGTQMPDDYLMKMSDVQARAGMAALRNWAANKSHRQRIRLIYSDCLHRLKIPLKPFPEHIEHTYIRFPILVSDRKAFLTAAAASRIPMGDWMLSPIHPIEGEFEKWSYHWGSNPQGEYLSTHVVNLFTDLSVSEKQARRTCQFLETQREMLLG